jgi:hypothetical protein
MNLHEVFRASDLRIRLDADETGRLDGKGMLQSRVSVETVTTPDVENGWSRAKLPNAAKDNVPEDCISVFAHSVTIQRGRHFTGRGLHHTQHQLQFHRNVSIQLLRQARRDRYFGGPRPRPQHLRGHSSRHDPLRHRPGNDGAGANDGALSHVGHHDGGASDPCTRPYPHHRGSTFLLPDRPRQIANAVRPRAARNMGACRQQGVALDKGQADMAARTDVDVWADAGAYF